MAMNIDRAGRGRDILLLGALSMGSFGLTTLAVWPTAEVHSARAAKLVRQGPVIARADSTTGIGLPDARLATAVEPELSVLPAPTLQELAADSDTATRDEAQLLLVLLGEEAAADQPL